ncbi:hypothetical protein [Tsukamurella sp. PLM1]|uniref:hypothetical protein n=1 Tax=Tsukamurella sp. PLM1 TaxID=2929795 RepID=UPI002047A1A4|nr:hypothetical protein [Tsukamurella sp. PLM1]BDH57692.1 hypothetical protein MTP03_26310 [Tsukamurella sp. PLM1]
MAALPPHLITDVYGLDAERVGRLADGLATRLRTVDADEPIPYLPLTDEHYDHSIALHPHVRAGERGGRAHRRERSRA